MSNYKQQYQADGYLTAIRLLSAQEAGNQRTILEQAEAQVGPLHYKTKIHTLLRSPFEVATRPEVLDIIEELIGPDIMLYNATYIIKEAHSQAHVSWHQDLTYWGFDQDDQVSMWLALSPATELSGCMKMLPGSHMHGEQQHHFTEDTSNVLLSGQTIKNVDETKAVVCDLAPGEASFHHGWTMHTSLPNRSDDRRIGLNVQFIAPHVKQVKGQIDGAVLVRGEDHYHHFETDTVAMSDLSPEAIVYQQQLEQRYIEIAGTGN